MKKDSYYFSHDASAQDDPKCILLIEQLGMEGYGIYWALVELLRQEKDYKLPLIILPGLARRWNTAHEKVKVVISSFDLFCIEDDKFFSLRLIRSMEEYNNQRLRLSQAGLKGGLRSAEARLKQPSSIKGKESKIKESKGNIINKENSENEKNPFFYLGGLKVSSKPSEVYEKSHKLRLDNLLMTQLRGIDKQKLFEEFDSKYQYTEFVDEKHFHNAILSTGKQILKQNFNANNRGRDKVATDFSGNF
jgi:hypothetical protein